MERRQLDRFPLMLDAELEHAGVTRAAVIFDLSAAGAKVRVPGAGIHIGDGDTREVVLSIPSFGDFDGGIVWTDDEYIGVEFHENHKTTVNLIIALSVRAPGVTNAALLPGLSGTRLSGWLAMPVLLGLVLLPFGRWRSRRLMVGLGLLMLLCSLVLTSCDSDDDPLVFRVVLPAQGVSAQGAASGPLMVPATSIVSSLIVIQP